MLIKRLIALYHVLSPKKTLKRCIRTYSIVQDNTLYVNFRMVTFKLAYLKGVKVRQTK